MILDYLSCCYLWEFYRAGFTIALAIRSFDPIRSLDLSTRLIPSGALVRANSASLYTCRAAGAFKGWCAVHPLQLLNRDREVAPTEAYIFRTTGGPEIAIVTD